MKLHISYDPESDTLDIGNGLPGSDGQPIADGLVAFFGDGDDTVGITLENAVEILGPIFREDVMGLEARVLESALGLEIHYFSQTDTLDIGNGKPSVEGYDVADNLTAHVDAEGDVMSVTLEHAAEVLGAYLGEFVFERGSVEAPFSLEAAYGSIKPRVITDEGLDEIIRRVKDGKAEETARRMGGEG